MVVLLSELVQCVPCLDVFHVVFVVESVALSCVVVAFSDLAPESDANVVFVDAAVAFASQRPVVFEDFVDEWGVELWFELLDHDVFVDFGLLFSVVSADQQGNVVVVVVMLVPPSESNFREGEFAVADLSEFASPGLFSCRKTDGGHTDVEFTPM